LEKVQNNLPNHHFSGSMFIFQGVSLQAALSQNIWRMYQLHLYTPQPWHPTKYCVAGGWWAS